MSDLLGRHLDEAFRMSVSSATQDAVAQLSRDAEQRAHEKPSILRRFSRRTLGSAAIVLSVGAGAATTATAAPAIIDWLGFAPDTSSVLVLDSGITCEVGFVAMPASLAADGSSTRATAVAQEYLRSVDLAALPLRERIEEDRKNPFFSESGPGAPELSDRAQLSFEISRALGGLVSEGMWAKVTSEGYDASDVSIEGGVNCSDEASE
jgi:hypothetical protein